MTNENVGSPRGDGIPEPPTLRKRRRVISILRSFSGHVLEILFPPVCAGCNVSGTWLCGDCDAGAKRIDLGGICSRCGRPRKISVGDCSRCEEWASGLVACRSVFEFDGPVREAIHRLKYENEPARAEWCGREMAVLLQRLAWGIDIIIPVPLHQSRLRSRGYNQSECIARELAKLAGAPVEQKVIRARKTMSQVGLSGGERLENVAGAFVAGPGLAGLNVLLIDDVITTGATIRECATACASAGAKAIYALTVATEV